MTSPARTKARQSMNPAGLGLVERDLNPQVRAEGKGKKRAVQSMGGKGDLSPKSQARRFAVCLHSNVPLQLIFYQNCLTMYHGDREQGLMTETT